MSAEAAVLLVDDDEGFRYAQSKALMDAGFMVMAAPDYREAIKLLSGDEPVDVLVTDVVMPHRINGFALARMARMRRAGLKTIYVTGYDVPNSEAIGPVLRKPVTPQDLLAQIRRTLSDRDPAAAR